MNRSHRREVAKMKTSGRPRSLSNSNSANGNDSDSDETVIEPRNKSVPARRSQSDTNRARRKEPNGSIQVVDISLSSSSDDEAEASNDPAEPDPQAVEEGAEEASDSDTETIIGEQVSVTSDNVKAQKRGRPKSATTPSKSQPQAKRRKLSSSFEDSKEDSSDDDNMNEVPSSSYQHQQRPSSASLRKRPGPRTRTLQAAEPVVDEIVENIPSTSELETEAAKSIIQDLKICKPTCECPPSTTWYKCNQCSRVSTSKASIIRHKNEAHRQSVEEDEEEFSSD